MTRMATDSLPALLASTIAPQATILYVGEAISRELMLSLQPARVLVCTQGQVQDGEDGTVLEYCRTPLEALAPETFFDCVIVADVLQDQEAISRTLHILRGLCREGSTLVISSGERPSLAHRALTIFSHYDGMRANWLPPQLLHSLLEIAGFCLAESAGPWLRAQAMPVRERRRYSYSIMIPCYNEEGNIAECVTRIPDLQRDCEIIVVNDGSTDRTAEVVRSLMPSRPNLRLVDYGDNRGKGYATMVGLNAATKEVLMILDADMAVRPEDLPLFMEPFELADAEFVNGTRMVYPFTREAMGPVHVFGNRMFSWLLSLLLGSPFTDTLCGTKCLFRHDYLRLQLKDLDWPDFDLLFGASRLKLKTVEVPIRYQPRLAGVSKMKTFKHGFLMFMASIRGYYYLKLNSQS